MKKKISKLSDHNKLINLIAVESEKDMGHLLQSVDQVFMEVFKLKKRKIYPGYQIILMKNGTV